MELVRIGGVRVDLNALTGIAHTCDPERCRHRESCCASYEICLDKADVERVAGMMPHVVGYVPRLGDADDFDNPFEKIEPNLYAMDTDEDGLCPFAYRVRGGAVMCSIHSAAVELGLKPYATKPRSCSLWPLSLSEDRVPILGVQEDAFRFPCNRRRSGRNSLHRNVASIVVEVFGEGFLREIDEALRGADG